METNVMSKISQPISAKLSHEEIRSQITIVLQELQSIYSYLVYAKYNKDALSGWVVEYTIAQTDEYNTLYYEDILDELVDTLISARHDKKHVIGYKQPSIELMTKLFVPFVNKLAQMQSDKWLELEYEDAISMCWLTMLKLYQRGYYIHKSLLAKSFNNDVLVTLRHSKNKPETVSLEQIAHDDGDSDALSVIDMLPDKTAELKQEDEENLEIMKLIFSDVKDIIIDCIGERQFEQIFRDYTNKNTTPWSRKKMQQIKEHFKKLGITWKLLEEHYEN